MRRRTSTLFRRAIASVLLVAFAALLPAQSSEDDESIPGIDDPVPYSPEEFPQWSRDLRRGEIIALGVFPIAMIVSGLGYQAGRFAYRSIEAGEADADSAPWFFSPEGGPVYNNQERVGLVVSGVVISVGVAVADYLLGRRERRDRDRN
ncbi:MAG: hypothetical protein MI724_01325 [Spirochaetales bacterium]|nr:hypothetical protein [Spirochaetales bacterium]